MKLSGLIRLTHHPVCTAYLNGELKELPLARLPAIKGAVAVLLPSIDIALTQVDVPSQQRQKILQAAPYALEDQFADDVDNMHFALGHKTANGQHNIAAISHQRMESALKRLKAAGIQSYMIVPDVLAVPYPDDGWAILLISGLALVRTAEQQGFAIEQDQLNTYLNLALEQHKAVLPTRIWLHQNIRSEHQFILDTIEKQNIKIEVRSHQQGAIRLFFETLQTQLQTRGQSPLNLLQGARYLHSKGDQVYKLWQPWRFSTALAASLCLLWLVQALHETQQWRTELQYYRTDNIAVYRQAFPDTQRVVNPKVQMQRGLAALQAKQHSATDNKQVLNLLNIIAPTLKSIQNLAVQSLNFREKRLDLKVYLPTFSDLETLTQTLKKLGLKIDMRHAESRQQRVEAVLRIQII